MVPRTLNSTESAVLKPSTDKRDCGSISARDVLITGGSFVKVENGGFHTHTHTHTYVYLSGMEKLREIVAYGALHDSKERSNSPKCHPSTRRSVLKKIMEWVEGLETINRFIWLYGPVGVGKSAIAQTISELCFDINILAASFFFSRMAPNCSDSTLVIATIAYQLCLSIPEVSSYIAAAVERDPNILRLSLETQVQKLIIWPLSKVKFQPTSSRSVSSRPTLIVIDGLDECNDEDMQRCILEALSGIFKSHSFPIYFLITSRPEQHIRECFHTEPLSSLTTFIPLDDSYFPDNDIEAFLSSEFHKIKEEHPLIPASWPSERDIKQLVEQSSGQFVYASMVIKYVTSSQPMACLDNIIAGRGRDNPFAELDALYNRIFSTVDDIHTVLQLLSILLFAKEHWFPRTVNLNLIEGLLDLKGDALHRKLIRLHSILDIPALDDDKTEIRILHPSLKDFLQDRTRSGQYYIDEGGAHAKLTQRLMTFIPSVRECQSASSYFLLAFCPWTLDLPLCIGMDELQRLSCQFFIVHCVSSYPTPELLADLRNFDISGFLSLLLSKYQLGLSPMTINRQISDLFGWLKHQVCRLQVDFLCHSFLTKHRFIIQGCTPLLPARELHASYLRAWDKHIITSLLVAVEHPQVRLTELFVTSALHPQFWKHCTIIREIINWKEPQGEMCLLNYSFHPLCAGELDEEEPDSTTGYYEMLLQFLNDSSRSGPFYADEAKFTSLATKTVQFIMDREVEITKCVIYEMLLHVSKLNGSHNNIDLHSQIMFYLMMTYVSGLRNACRFSSPKHLLRMS